ncbi:hypothetical protein TNIN_79741 [Trichonephila inaurata madagascariensis]|uniref:Uncharacterized protein n=1 Tax=Trichonephila inaurata madagascariensis TaxID=2747483 RepID=A0A8X7BZD7_9ARAC|nr:hypothetical protein TNIN_79741 [Trichonephila inaurata madagascariensis]
MNPQVITLSSALELYHREDLTLSFKIQGLVHPEITKNPFSVHSKWKQGRAKEAMSRAEREKRTFYFPFPHTTLPSLLLTNLHLSEATEHFPANPEIIMVGEREGKKSPFSSFTLNLTLRLPPFPIMLLQFFVFK